MYLHMGQNTVTPYDSIIGIFDLDTTSHSKRTKAFLANAQKNGQVKTVTDDLPASFVLSYRDGKTTIYLSRLSSKALHERIVKPCSYRVHPV